jgi:hypothetical protein
MLYFVVFNTLLLSVLLSHQAEVEIDIHEFKELIVFLLSIKITVQAPQSPSLQPSLVPVS